MSKTILEMTLSLDGFIAGPNVSMTDAMGVGGDRLHQWIFDKTSTTDNDILNETGKLAGAVIIGKTMFDVGLQHWNDTPYPLPTFVVSHQPKEKLQMKSNSFTFVTDGVQSALSHAKSSAGEKDVLIMGGAYTARQFLKARIVDELWLHVVGVLLGDGIPLFGSRRREKIELERFFLVGGKDVTHMKFRVTSK